VLTLGQRRLYDMNQGPDRDPAVVAAIERAKGFERRRCGHLMDEAAKPERECMLSVVDPKGDGRNKWRYIVMTQDEELVCFFSCLGFGVRDSG
jgi:U3 small nucleolar RNA-associated protein 23